MYRRFANRECLTIVYFRYFNEISWKNWAKDEVDNIHNWDGIFLFIKFNFFSFLFPIKKHDRSSIVTRRFKESLIKSKYLSSVYLHFAEKRETRDPSFPLILTFLNVYINILYHREGKKHLLCWTNHNSNLATWVPRNKEI